MVDAHFRIDRSMVVPSGRCSIRGLSMFVRRIMGMRMREEMNWLCLEKMVLTVSDPMSMKAKRPMKTAIAVPSRLAERISVKLRR